MNEAFDTLRCRPYKPKGENVVDIADHAAGYVANAIVRLQRLEAKAESQFGRPAPHSEPVLTTVDAEQS